MIKLHILLSWKKSFGTLLIQNNIYNILVKNNQNLNFKKRFMTPMRAKHIVFVLSNIIYKSIHQLQTFRS